MQTLRIFFLFLFSFIVWLAVRQYLFCPVYSFSGTQPFSGNQWYNPYTFIDSGKWIKCNFHTHTKAWGGLTNGHGNAEEIWKAYDSMGYTIHAVSNYHKINNTFHNQPNFVSAYEHGYNIKKTHQLVIGGNKVLWLDYLFPQTLSNKQNILKRLWAKGDNVIVANHPGLNSGYTEEDMKQLTRYNCIEVLHPKTASFPQWDAALSSGIPVFGIGNDDMHNISKSVRIGRFCTWLYVSSVDKKNVIHALKNGIGFAMRTAVIKNEDRFTKQQRLRQLLPPLKKFSLFADTLRLVLIKSAKEIRFIGQNGRACATFNDTSTAYYRLTEEDTYIRIAVQFHDGTAIYLNPVFRHSGSPLTSNVGFSINNGKTVFNRIAGTGVLIAWSAFIARVFFPGIFSKRRRRK